MNTIEEEYNKEWNFEMISPFKPNLERIMKAQKENKIMVFP